MPRLDLVPANQGLLELDKILFGRPGFEYRLRQQLGGPIGQQYDVVIFDCPPAFGTLTMNALTAADLLLIPVLCDYFSARSLQQFLELVNLVQHNTNAALRYRIKDVLALLPTGGQSLESTNARHSRPTAARMNARACQLLRDEFLPVRARRVRR